MIIVHDDGMMMTMTSPMSSLEGHVTGCRIRRCLNRVYDPVGSMSLPSSCKRMYMFHHQVPALMSNHPVPFGVILKKVKGCGGREGRREEGR